MIHSRWLVAVAAVVSLCACGSDSTGASEDDLTACTSCFPDGKNPVPGWHPTRVDQGVDGTLSGSGFVAPFEVRVVYAYAHSSGWDNGGYLAVKILHGALAGQFLYIAEGIVPVVHAGEDVAAGARLCDRVTNPYNGVFGNIEAGFADPNEPLRPLAQALPGYSGDQSIAAITAGEAMNKLIKDLGGAAGVNESGNKPEPSLLPAQIRNALHW